MCNTESVVEVETVTILTLTLIKTEANCVPEIRWVSNSHSGSWTVNWWNTSSDPISMWKYVFRDLKNG